MHPGIDPAPLADGVPAGLVAEGAGYAAALLDRIAAGTSSPADFAAVVSFLQCHPMLLGFAGVLLDALRAALAVQREPRH
ncbi:MAG: hypothetical protein H6933_07190 [Burkholderiaceae bacterium]|nr:hypothetical protein [Rhodoferax sp.]MCP5284664.1 hypothetical protein [Burkholderiaceae bacterium]